MVMVFMIMKKILTNPLNLHHDQISQVVPCHPFPLHDVDQGRGDVLFGFNTNDWLQQLTQGAVVCLYILLI